MIVVFDLTVHKYCNMISHTKTEQTIYNIHCYQTLMAITTIFTGPKEAIQLEELSKILNQLVTLLIGQQTLQPTFLFTHKI